MTVAVGFFDESTDSTDENLQGVAYAVAGFISHNETSAILELRWKDLLTQYNLKYFKASELSAGEGQFRQYRDDPSRREWRPFSQREALKFSEIHTAFTDLIVEFSGQLNGIGAVVVLPDYHKLMEEYPLARKVLSYPYYLAGQLVLTEAGLCIEGENKLNTADRQMRLRPVFDSHEEYSGRMKAIFDSFCAKNPRSSRYLLPPHYEDDQYYLSLQVADNIAFEVRKYAVATLNKSPRVRRSTERIKPALWRIFKLDYAGLKTIADANDSGELPLSPIGLTADALLGEN